jgi:hypothetical protein
MATEDKDPDIILAIVGWRKMTDVQLVRSAVGLFIKKFGLPRKIISGGCTGADTLGRLVALEMGYKIGKDFKDYMPDFTGLVGRQRNRAYGIRDEKIAKKCTHMIAFPHPSGKGTQLTMKMAKNFGKHVTVVELKK